MFLAMQVRSSAWRGRRLLAVAAWAALVELFVPLLASLITLMNGNPWQVASGVAGGLGLFVVAAHWLIFFRFPKGDHEQPIEDADTKTLVEKFNRLQLRGSLISIIVYGTMMIALFNPWAWGLHLLAICCVWLLVSGSFEALWLLEPKFAAGNRATVAPTSGDSATAGPAIRESDG